MLESWFPTVIYYEDLDTPEEENEKFLAYISNFAKEKKYEWSCHSNLTGTSPVEFTIHNNPTFEWLNQQVSHHARQYLIDMGVNIDEISIYAQKSWPLICKEDGGELRPHSHSATISCVYYPEEVVGEGGNLNFYGDRLAAPMAVRIDKAHHLNYKAISYPPRKNRLLVFPSSLLHGVDPFRGNTNRCSIAYDLMVTSNGSSKNNEMMIIDPSFWRKL